MNTPHAAERLRTLRTHQLARQIDPWADAWEDGRPAEPPRTARATQGAARGHQPTEEVTP
jgi:hypothetical protein